MVSVMSNAPYAKRERTMLLASDPDHELPGTSLGLLGITGGSMLTEVVPIS